VTAVIEDHHRVIARQHPHVIREVFLRATESVHQHESGTLAGNLDLEPHPVIHRDPHSPMVTRIGPPRPPRNDDFGPPGT